MKTKVYVSFNYGGWHLSFKKDFDLEFTPFYDLSLMDLNDEYENIVEFKNNDYCQTIIFYDVNKKEFEVDVRWLWKEPVRDDTIDDTIERFFKSGWERTDRENIDNFKKLMNSEYERKNKL